MIKYFELSPPRALQAYVKCFWRLRADAALAEAPPPEPIVPDGCVELVLHLGEPFARYDASGRAERQPRQVLAGQITSAIVVQPSTTINVWGVRFHPWAAGAFFGLPSVELRDRVVALDELSPRLARALDDVSEVDTDDQQLASLVRALSVHAASPTIEDVRIRGILDAVVAHNVDYSVRGLANHLGLGARRVDALFRDHVGLSPKQVLRIYRFQRALALRRALPSASWASISARAGYYDQAHLVRDARAISGAAPSELLLNAGGLTEIFLANPAPDG